MAHPSLGHICDNINRLLLKPSIMPSLPAAPNWKIALPALPHNPPNLTDIADAVEYNRNIRISRSTYFFPNHWLFVTDIPYYRVWQMQVVVPRRAMLHEVQFMKPPSLQRIIIRMQELVRLILLHICIWFDTPNLYSCGTPLVCTSLRSSHNTGISPLKTWCAGGKKLKFTIKLPI